MTFGHRLPAGGGRSHSLGRCKYPVGNLGKSKDGMEIHYWFSATAVVEVLNRCSSLGREHLASEAGSERHCCLHPCEGLRRAEPASPPSVWQPILRRVKPLITRICICSLVWKVSPSPQCPWRHCGWQVLGTEDARVASKSWSC